MKRIAAFFLALLMTLAAGMGAYAEEVQETSRLVVGNPTPLNGDFFTDLWGNGTSDMDVRNLLHANNLVKWDTANGLFTVDESVVTGSTVMENAAGDRSYILVLRDDLRYSDGTPITAWDYAFSLLLQISPELEKICGKTLRAEYLLGYEAYRTGESSFLPGVRVTSDRTIMITVNHESLPYFYELALLSCNPYPIHEIAPGVAVRDDGNGVYLANEDETVTEPVFTEELLRQTILDPETGYRSHPKVVSGPYMLTSWDGSTAEFEVNPYYLYGPTRKQPAIQQLVFRRADNGTMIAQLSAGEFGLLNKVMNAATIQQGLNLTQEGQTLMSSYPRSGLSFVAFACERAGVSDAAVRKAIAQCMDREKIMQEYTGNFGLLADGYYGVGQWMYGLVSGSIPIPVDEPGEEATPEEQAAYELEVSEWQKLEMNTSTAYALNVEEARRVLEEAGWKTGEDGIREKEIEGETVRLELKMAYPEGNQIAESFKTHFVAHLEEAGIRLELVPTAMDALLKAYHTAGERDADMMFLASNFDSVFDPASHFTEDEEGNHLWETAGMVEEELYQEAMGMRNTEPGDVLGYLSHWIGFQERFAEDMPLIPVYSNVYFDFFTQALEGYNIEQNTSWARAIVEATLGGGQEEPETTEAP